MCGRQQVPSPKCRSGPVTCPHFTHPTFFTFSHSPVTPFVWTHLLLSSHLLCCLNRFSAISKTSPHSTAHSTVPSSSPTLPSDSSPPPLSSSSLFIIQHDPPLSPLLCRFLLRLRDLLMWPIVCLTLLFCFPSPSLCFDYLPCVSMLSLAPHSSLLLHSSLGISLCWSQSQSQSLPGYTCLIW